MHLRKSVTEHWTSICQREIDWISEFAIPRAEDDPLRQMDSQEDPACHIDLLQRCITLAPHLEPPPSSSAPVLWHHDLSLRNILISNDTKPKIISILDWQNVSIVPLFLKFDEPSFIGMTFVPPGERVDPLVYERSLDTHETEWATEIVSLNQHYNRVLSRLCPQMAEALSIPFKETEGILIRDCTRSWEKRKGIVYLRQGLINIWRNWNKYGLPGAAPISFTKEELDNHLEDGKGMNDNRDFIEGIRQSIGMGPTGEVDANDYEEKKKYYEEVKRRFIVDMNEKVERVGFTENIDWELYWPFRYPEGGF
jgi:Phosphotransferase enzyme family